MASYFHTRIAVALSMDFYKSGFNFIYNIDEGFEGDLNEKHQRSTKGGWRFYGLPWEQC